MKFDGCSGSIARVEMLERGRCCLRRRSVPVPMLVHRSGRGEDAAADCSCDAVSGRGGHGTQQSSQNPGSSGCFRGAASAAAACLFSFFEWGREGAAKVQPKLVDAEAASHEVPAEGRAEPKTQAPSQAAQEMAVLEAEAEEGEPASHATQKMRAPSASDHRMAALEVAGGGAKGEANAPLGCSVAAVFAQSGSPRQRAAHGKGAGGASAGGGETRARTTLPGGGTTGTANVCSDAGLCADDCPLCGQRPCARSCRGMNKRQREVWRMLHRQDELRRRRQRGRQAKAAGSGASEDAQECAGGGRGGGSAPVCRHCRGPPRMGACPGLSVRQRSKTLSLA